MVWKNPIAIDMFLLVYIFIHMLNILKTKKKLFKDQSLNNHSIEDNKKCTGKLQVYFNTIHNPYSSKEWSNSVYSYNKSYIKSLIVFDVITNNMLTNYFNMLEDKVKVVFKRRRTNKIRYSMNKIFISRGEFKHVNTGLTIIIYVYNKQKSYLENLLTKINTLPIFNHSLKKFFFYFKEWYNIIFVKNDNYIDYLMSNLKTKFNIYDTLKFKKTIELYGLCKKHTDYVKSILFNNLKFNNLYLNWNGLGITSIIEKLYNKDANIKIIEQRSIHLNSDTFSSPIYLKLRNRRNKAIKILRKAILNMVKIPDIHTLRIYYTNINIYKNNVLEFINQQVVSGILVKAKGRLTPRLTASRAIFKTWYMGSRKNLRASLTNTPSKILRGSTKLNLQYSVEESKNRNGAFGLQVWTSSH